MMATPLSSSPWVTSTKRWLAQRAPRERRLLAAAAAAVALALVWWAIWQPMASDITRMRAMSLRAQADLADARRMADAIPGLERAARAVPAAPLQAEVERILTSALGRPAGLAIDLQDQRVRVTLPNVSVTALATLLETLQREALIQTAEARLTARVEPGTVRAELVLTR
jgi:type II secretory pathway component PulM